MPKEQTYPILIRSRNDRELPPTRGELTRIYWERPERMKNAVRTTGLWLGIMCGSALVPFWHYFLVPSFFITAWVLGFDKWKEITRCGGGTGECPHCHHGFKIGNSSWKIRLTETCESCFQELELNPQTADQ
jgi:hypothetical protein